MFQGLGLGVQGLGLGFTVWGVGCLWRGSKAVPKGIQKVCSDEL